LNAVQVFAVQLFDGRIELDGAEDRIAMVVLVSMRAPGSQRFSSETIKKRGPISGRQAGRQATDRQTDRQRDRQTERQTDRQKVEKKWAKYGVKSES
jgi:hypothetical protein